MNTLTVSCECLDLSCSWLWIALAGRYGGERSWSCLVSTLSRVGRWWRQAEAATVKTGVTQVKTVGGSKLHLAGLHEDFSKTNRVASVRVCECSCCSNYPARYNHADEVR